MTLMGAERHSIIHASGIQSILGASGLSVIKVPSIEELKCKTCYLFKWKASRSLTQFSRRGLVCDIEQFFARAFRIEFRCIETNALYQPALCWPDPDARSMGDYLQTNAAGDGPRRYCTRILERQRQIFLHHLGTISFFGPATDSLRWAHGHPGAVKPKHIFQFDESTCAIRSHL